MCVCTLCVHVCLCVWGGTLDSWFMSALSVKKCNSCNLTSFFRHVQVQESEIIFIKNPAESKLHTCTYRHHILEVYQVSARSVENYQRSCNNRLVTDWWIHRCRAIIIMPLFKSVGGDIKLSALSVISEYFIICHIFPNVYKFQNIITIMWSTKCAFMSCYLTTRSTWISFQIAQCYCGCELWKYPLVHNVLYK